MIHPTFQYEIPFTVTRVVYFQAKEDTQENIEMTDINACDESVKPDQPSTHATSSSSAPFLCSWQNKESPMDNTEDETDDVKIRSTNNPLFNEIIRSRHATGNDEQDSSTAQTNRIVKKVLLIDKGRYT